MATLLNMVISGDALDAHIGGKGSGIYRKLATDMERVHSKCGHMGTQLGLWCKSRK
jgi:hypothetical protein